MTTTIQAKFRVGNLVATPALIAKVSSSYALAALAQHVQGKWGMVDAHDAQVNEDALKHGGRLVSVYPLPNDPDNFWIITEADYSVTTILLPEDY